MISERAMWYALAMATATWLAARAGLGRADSAACSTFLAVLAGAAIVLRGL
jgi:hypothetical protein